MLIQPTVFFIVFVFRIIKAYRRPPQIILLQTLPADDWSVQDPNPILVALMLTAVYFRYFRHAPVVHLHVLLFYFEVGQKTGHTRKGSTSKSNDDDSIIYLKPEDEPFHKVFSPPNL